MANKSFSASNPNTDSGTLAGGVLEVNGGPILIDQKSILDNPVIPGIVNIYISTTGGGSYTNRIDVVGRCPEGKYDTKLEFTDETGDTYTLRIYSETLHTHSVYYNSDKPNITTVTWDI